MDAKEALGREMSWRNNNGIRPDPALAKEVAGALAAEVSRLTEYICANALCPCCQKTDVCLSVSRIEKAYEAAFNKKTENVPTTDDIPSPN